MATTLRLTDDELAALRETAEREHRSMQEVAREAIRAYTSQRTRRRDDLLSQIVSEDANLLDRLGKA
jgi:predicted transcriptional regulator